MKNAILDRPWLLIIGGYLFALGAWVLMITVAVRNRDQTVPLVPAVQK